MIIYYITKNFYMRKFILQLLTSKKNTGIIKENTPWVLYFFHIGN